MALKPEKTKHCLNCEDPLGEANYCANCGQKNDARRITIGQLLGETLGNILSFDGRLFYTLKSLFTKPGQAALDFNSGKRIRHMNPIRLYFLSSVLMLFAFSYNQGEKTLIDANFEHNRVDAAKQKLSEQQIEQRVDSLHSYYALGQAAWSDRVSALIEYYSYYPEHDLDQALNRLELRVNFWNRFWAEQAKKLSYFNNSDDNYREFNQTFRSKLLWVLFLFVPILALILKLLYWRHDIYYIELLFFTFFQQAFLFLLLFATNFLPEAGIVQAIVLLGFGLYQYLGLKRYFRQSFKKTFFKLLVYLFLGLLLFAIFFVLAAVVVFLFI